MAHWHGLARSCCPVSEEAVSDEDLLALLLSYLNSTINSRKLAMQLITRFETFGNVVSARSAQITGAAEIQPEIIGFLKVVRAAGTRLAREEISYRPVLDAWDKLIKYLRAAMAHEMVEQFRVLFLDRRNVLITDELHASWNDRPYAGVSSRGGQARAGAGCLGNHHGPQPPEQSSGSVES